ncbi:desulfoferrodoxin [Lachnospiraceae bacterium ZAX-1]
MSKEQKFFICKHCGNLVGFIDYVGVKVICCGEEMSELIANTSDGATEKHVPVISQKGDEIEVSVGSAAHPMLEAHYIKWIYLLTEKGGQRKSLKPGEDPKVRFSLVDDKAIRAYAYCNLHGLWKADV